MWLYESTKNIEFRFGNCNVQNKSINYYDSTGFHCGLFDKLNRSNGSWIDSFVLNGTFANPYPTIINPNYTQVYGTIQSNYVYKFTKISTAGIDELFGIGKIKPYPNPASDKLYIGNIPSRLNNATIEFYDVAGKQIHSEELKHEIDLSNFNKGIYIVKIKTKNNENVFLNKIVIMN